MRDLRFRAWDKEVKTMLKVDYLTSDKKDNMLFASGFNEHHKRIATQKKYKDKCILMQYTGLKDKNGKEIYEGDILCKKYHKKGFPVEWSSSGSWAIGKYLLPYASRQDEFDIKNPKLFYYEVIGNIYENPNLLEDK